MKKNIFKIVSCMLATTMLLTGCNGAASIELASNAPSTAKTMTVATENFNMGDYLVYDNSYKNLVYSTSVVDLVALYGQNVYVNGNFYVFKKITKDFKNNVIEDFTVYDADKNAVVKTFKNEYFDGDYGAKDKFGNVKKAPKTLDVTILTRARVNVIKVVEKTNTKIDEEVIEENKLNDSYVTTIKTSYYDCTGKEITTTNLGSSYDDYSQGNNQVKMIIGNTVAIFDRDTQAMVDKWNAHETYKASLYDYQNDKYGFYLGSEYNKNIVFETYDVKTGKYVNRYYSEPEYMASNAIVLKDGNVLVQKVKIANEYNYNLKQDNMYYIIDTLLVDPATGKSNKVEGCEYIFSDLLDAKDFEEYGLKATDKKVDVLKGGKIVNKEYPNNSEWVFLDGLKIVGTYDGKVLVNQAEEFVVPEKVSNTLYTIAISDPAYTGYDRALVDKNNKVITYLKGSDKVIGGYIYTNNGIYSSNLEEEVNYEFIVSDMNSLSIQGYVGRYAVITYSYGDNYYIKYIASEYEYNTLQNSQIVELNENYLLIQTEDGDYVLYNAEMNKLLTSENQMFIKTCGDNIVVETISYGKNAIYFFSNNGGAL